MNKIGTVGMFVLVLLFSIGCKRSSEHATEAEESQTAAEPFATKEAEGLPKVTLIDDTEKQFSATTLPGNSVLIFFSSDCDHCQREATEIEKNLKGFSNYTLYFISMNPFSEMNKFAVTYKLNQVPNVKFLRADGRTVFDALGSIQTPTIFVYNGDKKLKKRFDGETKVDDILQAL